MARARAAALSIRAAIDAARRGPEPRGWPHPGPKGGGDYDPPPMGSLIIEHELKFVVHNAKNMCV